MAKQSQLNAALYHAGGHGAKAPKRAATPAGRGGGGNGKLAPPRGLTPAEATIPYAKEK
jgi:hypothetical protein